MDKAAHPRGITQSLHMLKNGNLSSIYQGHYERLELLYDGGSLDTPFGLQGISISTTDDNIDAEQWFTSSLAAVAEQIEAASDESIFRPMSICCNPHGVHFIDDIFGAEVFIHPFSNQWQSIPLKTPVGTLRRPETDINPSWNLVRGVAKLFEQHDPPNVVLELPTLSSALNIAVNLYGEEFLVALLTEPAAAHHDLNIINEVIKELHGWFIERFEPERIQPIVASGRFQPCGHGQICGCTTQLLSRQVYAECIEPFDADVLSCYPNGGLIHLCGKHTQHLRTWRHMSQVKAVQLNDRAAIDLSDYHSGLRNDQIIYVNYFEDMPIREILKITGGQRLILTGDFDEQARAVLMEHKTH